MKISSPTLPAHTNLGPYNKLGACGVCVSHVALDYPEEWNVEQIEKATRQDEIEYH